MTLKTDWYGEVSHEIRYEGRSLDQQPLNVFFNTINNPRSVRATLATVINEISYIVNQTFDSISKQLKSCTERIDYIITQIQSLSQTTNNLNGQIKYLYQKFQTLEVENHTLKAKVINLENQIARLKG